ncbi:hypothetical protein [Marinomonas mediterranea]|uniref:hypothetical protein n=1 Tax=Marinomonas mediterranea TaxID=119864 RepID=UPI0023495B99|nr:hypothetical protein [Marinomonas mediterranea]WCN07576.1 hypothetical protein GV055_00875 [Marinomonas mediterranea]WCN11674.1 hypothetical protein GV054_00885 [Marinomonas mediterranea]
MTWFYYILVNMILLSAFLTIYFAIFSFLAAGFPNKSKVIDGYFLYKPDIVKKALLYECVPIYSLNCVRYIFFIEQPPMPWWAKINVILSGLGCCGFFFLVALGLADKYLDLVDIDYYFSIVKKSGLPVVFFG